jgi:hypothetical protein
MDIVKKNHDTELIKFKQLPEIRFIPTAVQTTQSKLLYIGIGAFISILLMIVGAAIYVVAAMITTPSSNSFNSNNHGTASINDQQIEQDVATHLLRGTSWIQASDMGFHLDKSNATTTKKGQIIRFLPSGNLEIVGNPNSDLIIWQIALGDGYKINLINNNDKTVIATFTMLAYTDTLTLVHEGPVYPSDYYEINFSKFAN